MHDLEDSREHRFSFHAEQRSWWGKKAPIVSVQAQGVDFDDDFCVL
jgi:hypothetical protein